MDTIQPWRIIPMQQQVKFVNRFALSLSDRSVPFSGYMPTYPNQTAYYPANKYGAFNDTTDLFFLHRSPLVAETTTGDREYYGNYNQTSSTNAESSTSTGKEGGMKSRLSATAAAFQSPYPLATSASSSYIPFYTLPTTHFPPMDHRVSIFVLRSSLASSAV